MQKHIIIFENWHLEDLDAEGLLLVWESSSVWLFSL